VDNKKTKKRYRLDHLLKAQKQDKLDALYDILRGAPTFMTPSLQEGLKPDPEVLAKSLVYHYQAVARHYATTPDQVRTENQAVLMDVFGLSADEAKQGSPGVGKPDPRMFDSDERNPLDAAQVIDPGTNESGEWTAPRNFNLMFQTHVGPVEAAPGTEEELASRVYLRPETAQGIFMNFKNVLESSRKKVPFGIAQIGKSFRNEITPGNFTFRTREFEQMEMEFFIKPPQFVKPGEKNDDQWHEEWVNTRYSWWVTYGIPTERLRKRAQDKSELAHYAKATTDIEYLFPGALGWGEVEGIANRTDYDLTAHSRDIPEADLKRLHLEPNKDSVTTLDYFDSEAKARYMPWVIEPAAGATRAALTFLCEAYHEEIVKQPPPAEIDALKVEIDAVIKNADKKKKDAEKEKDPAQRKHDPVAITAFQAALADAASRLPASLMEIDYMLEDHAGAQNLEPVKKLKPKVNKLAEDCVRVVLKLHPKLAPVKVAVFPLARNKPELVDIATRLTRELRHVCKTIYDDSGGIGKLYRRQDEIGTPLCITVDHQTLEDNMVTIRDRDTMQQVRVPLDKVVHDCRNKLGIH
jgi:glycyl-tRNA synthetase